VSLFRILSVLGVVLILGTAAAAAPSEIADQRLEIATSGGTGLLPLYVSADWSRPLAEVKRAVVVFHGNGRNARGYFAYVKDAREEAGEPESDVLIVAPHFVTEEDLDRHPQPDGDRLLRWTSQAWKDGRRSEAPVRASSFDAVDAIIARLADRRRFPALRSVVLAGHSAGGQLLNRYAAAGRGPDRLSALGIAVRYVVANTSSYLYFSDDRPRRARRRCSGLNDWKYGLDKPPSYVRDTARLETTYIARDVVYLLGEKDNDPDSRYLDRRCEAEAQGENRLERGESYFAYLKARHPALRHRLRLVSGIAHSARRMFASPCGRAALFGDMSGCP
jgi:hypothetical protein